MGSGQSTVTETIVLTRTVELIPTRVPMPVAGHLPLQAEILGEAEDRTTFAVRDCTTSASSCVLYEPLTITAGPRTYRFDGLGHWEVLGQLDCAMWGTPQTAACAWTVGNYPSSELKNLASRWITTPAASSATISPTITDGGAYAAQAFVNINVTMTNSLAMETTVCNSAAQVTGSTMAWTASAAGLSLLLVMMLEYYY